MTLQCMKQVYFIDNAIARAENPPHATLSAKKVWNRKYPPVYKKIIHTIYPMIQKTASEIIYSYAKEGALLREKFINECASKLHEAAFKAASCLARNGKILFCGNGGSAADSQHIAAEFINRFLMDRPALPAIALTTDTSIITAIGNDISFDEIFSRQVDAIGQAGDMLVAISTSGRSRNVLNAIEKAAHKKLYTVLFTGNNVETEKNSSRCDIVISVPSDFTPLIQEMHIMAAHLLCRITDYYLFENPAALSPNLDGKSLQKD